MKYHLDEDLGLWIRAETPEDEALIGMLQTMQLSVASYGTINAGQTFEGGRRSHIYAVFRPQTGGATSRRRKKA